MKIVAKICYIVKNVTKNIDYIQQNVHAVMTENIFIFNSKIIAFCPNKTPLQNRLHSYPIFYCFDMKRLHPK